ncbi:hypothetical protein Taro_053149 [Colocasia esculenta]|uniref:Pentatricopeptide repeat-containing protein n=1 Tax=Colocasia esculenta TaxID=4460 RepID=A0A843XLR4_COLES|nr:hypothetical protein [Colocasia esculenta]
MQLLLTRPSEITLVSVIGACGALGALSQGLWLHGYVLRSDHLVSTALIDMYGRRGWLELAVQLFDSLAVKDTISYNAIIRGLAVHGWGGPALKLFPEMRRNAIGVDERMRGIKVEEMVQKMPMRPNAAIYGVLLAACRMHKKFEIGDCVVGYLLQVEPGHGGNYVLLSNIYANMN